MTVLPCVEAASEAALAQSSWGSWRALLALEACPIKAQSSRRKRELCAYSVSHLRRHNRGASKAEVRS